MATSPDPNRYPQSNLNQWAYRQWHVALDSSGKNTNPITPENIFLAAGPAQLRDVGDNFGGKVFPLGLIDSWSIGQSKMVQQVREIGSRRSYIIGSYAAGQLQFSRTLFSQASLMRVMTLANDDQEDLDNPLGTLRGGTFTGQGSVARLAAEKYFAINMQASVLDRPVGILMYILDQRNQPYGACYVENMLLNSHGITAQAQGVVISESVAGMFDRILPVQVSA
jgi:hypothetical protein